MVVNFRVREISRSARKLAQTPTLIKKKNIYIYIYIYIYISIFLVYFLLYFIWIRGKLVFL
jgi:flagellar biosynthesis/type III secretory pathway M-ring protein FliF/YscJ